MGVKDLWSLLSPSAELITLSALNGKVLAIDLSCWICDSQNVHMGGNIVRPHLRNLFFRCISLVRSGITPIFVLEGVAPELKWKTIQSRIASRNKSKESFDKEKKCKRSRLKGLINQCRELLSLLGLPWVQAEGEAEATCAALCYHKIADGVITQDSDVFLYGANLVYRNFSANTNKSTVDKFNLKNIDGNLGLNRESLLCLSLLLGCDYLPQGVPGVGCKMGLQLIREWKEGGVKNCLERFQQWKNLSENNFTRGCKGTNTFTVESAIRQKAIAVDGFPFQNVIDEFTKQLAKPKVEVCWSRPNLSKLITWCSAMLEWPPEYSIGKVASIVSLWTVLHYKSIKSNEFLQLDPLTILKRCVRRGVPSFDIEWKINSESRNGLFLHSISCDSVIKTTETVANVELSFPNLISKFNEGKKKNVKERKKSTKPKTKKLLNCKESILNYVYVKEVENEYNPNLDLSFAIDRCLQIKMNPHHVSNVKLTQSSTLDNILKENNKCLESTIQIEKKEYFTNTSVIDLSSDEEGLGCMSNKSFKDKEVIACKGIYEDVPPTKKSVNILPLPSDSNCCSSNRSQSTINLKKGVDFNESVDIFDCTYNENSAVDINEQQTTSSYCEDDYSVHNSLDEKLGSCNKCGNDYVSFGSITRICDICQQSATNTMPCFDLIDSFNNLTLCLDGKNGNLDVESETNDKQTPSNIMCTLKVNDSNHCNRSLQISSPISKCPVGENGNVTNIINGKSNNIPCFQLVDSFDNLTLCLDNESSDLSNVNIAVNDMHTRIASDSELNCDVSRLNKLVLTDPRTPPKSKYLTKESIFVTPEVETSSLLDRLRRKHGDGVLNVLDL